MSGPVRVLVAEPSVPVSNALKLFLTSSGFEVAVVPAAQHVVPQAKKLEAVLVLAGVSPAFDGESLCAQLKAQDRHLPVVLIYPPEEELMIERATRAGADAWLMGPLKKAQVVAIARAMVRQQAYSRRVVELEAELQRLTAAQAAHSGTNTHDLGFFKKVVAMELKRGKRHQYPLAFLLVALDGLEERKVPDDVRAAIRAELLGTVSPLLRDIDLCMPFAEDRVLVFLPHTPREGAGTVASRLVAKLAKLKTYEGTASVGVAAFDHKRPASFDALAREASVNLRLAQEAGGNRVEMTPQASAGKRDRVSIV